MEHCPACDAPAACVSYLGRARFETFNYCYLECPACATLFASPMPGPEILNQIYGPTYIDTHYAHAGGVASGDLARELRAAAEQIRRLVPGGRVLDVGCGAGAFLRLLAELGLRAEGHERNPETAQKVAQATGLGVHSGPLSTLAQRYDAIHLADVLEHLPRPADLLAEIVPLLAEGGVILARGPLENQDNLFQRSVKWARVVRSRKRSLMPTPSRPTHVILFTLGGWNCLLGRAGLETVEEKVYEIHWPAVEGFSLHPSVLLKNASMVVSHSPLGRRRKWGNRVVSVVRASESVRSARSPAQTAAPIEPVQKSA